MARYKDYKLKSCSEEDGKYFMTFSEDRFDDFLGFMKQKRADIDSLIELFNLDEIQGLETYFDLEEYNFSTVFNGLNDWFRKAKENQIIPSHEGSIQKQHLSKFFI